VILVGRETRDTPAAVTETLLLAGGVNRFGEPNFRAVWGWNRLDWIGGKWEDRDEHGVLLREVTEFRREPKYFPVDRWHIERWLAPETYGPPSWWSLTLEPELGPYPSRGDYEHCFTVETRDGGFLELTPTVARVIASALDCSRARAKGNRLSDRNRFIDKQDRDYDSFADSVLNDGSTITGPMVAVA
jgi:hypothetical protein